MWALPDTLILNLINLNWVGLGIGKNVVQRAGIRYPLGPGIIFCVKSITTNYIVYQGRIHCVQILSKVVRILVQTGARRGRWGGLAARQPSTATSKGKWTDLFGTISPSLIPHLLPSHLISPGHANLNHPKETKNTININLFEKKNNAKANFSCPSHPSTLPFQQIAEDQQSHHFFTNAQT